MELNYRLSHQLTDSKAKTFPVEAGRLPSHYFFIDFDSLLCAI